MTTSPEPIAPDNPPPKKKRQARTAEVARVEQLTPHMIRVVFGGDRLAGFGVEGFTDNYVKLLFAPVGVSYDYPFDVEAIQAERPREEWPVARAYTVRAWDEARGELTIDFVYHGDEGVAGPWAAAAKPGDLMSFFGPGGAYAPSQTADWHLFVGDESALPAISASLERVPAGVPALVFLEVEDESEQQDLSTSAELAVTWVYRASSAPGAIVDAVRAAAFPDGAVDAFVHGDAGFVKEVRLYLRSEQQVPREALSVSGYWRRGRTDEGWRSEKRQWNKEVESAEEQLLANG